MSFEPGDRVRVCSQSTLRGQEGTVVATDRAIEVVLPGYPQPLPFSAHELERVPAAVPAPEAPVS